MSSTPLHTNCTILFADIAGSTRLYENLGNQKAQALVAQTLSTMERVVLQHDGCVIKTIGDEIMCSFISAENAIEAAIDLQEQVHHSEALNPIALRIGLHHDDVLQQDGDLFGDGVNTAARMTQLARANQIITSQQTIQDIKPSLKSACRGVGHTHIRGKAQLIHIYEVVWEAEEDLTRIATPESLQALMEKPCQQLTLHYHGQDVSVPHEASFVIGRSATADLHVNISLASRSHCIIEYRRGKYWLKDQSTNGTFVRTQDGKEVSLKREELPLWGQGQISLSGPVAENIEEVIYFNCNEL